MNGNTKFDCDAIVLGDRVNSLSSKNDSPKYQNVPSIVIIDIDNNSITENENKFENLNEYEEKAHLNGFLS